MKKHKRIKYPLNIKKLPDGVKEAWLYGGKNRSIHIVLKPVTKMIALTKGISINSVVEVPQINIEF